MVRLGERKRDEEETAEEREGKRRVQAKILPRGCHLLTVAASLL
jgi:hypothetical protein